MPSINSAGELYSLPRDSRDDEIDALRAENERLSKAWADSEAACLIQVQIVRAENERLRALVEQYRQALAATGVTLGST